MSKTKLFGIGLLTLVVLLGVIQLFPYGRDHVSASVRQEPAWDSPQTRELAVRACYDCHSNQVRWPWYSQVAPVSWLVQHDVEEGRSQLNFSEWNRGQEGDDVAEVVQEGEMPPWYYTILHPDARFNSQQQQTFIQGLVATFGGEGEGYERGEDED